jgi:hypothetical protein
MDNEPSQQTPDNPRTPEPPRQSPGGYKKRPVWQWVVLYVIVAAIVYAIIYMLITGNNGGGY